MNWNEYKEYLTNLIKDPSKTMDFINQKFSYKKIILLNAIGGLLLFPNFIIFQFSQAELWVYAAFTVALFGLLVVIFINYNVMFFLFSKLLYRNSDHPLGEIRKINTWNAATSFILCQVCLLPIQLGLLYIRENGVGLMLYWIIILIWYIWAMGLEFMAFNFHVKDQSLKNLYFTVITQILGFGIYQILIYIGLLSLY